MPFFSTILKLALLAASVRSDTGRRQIVLFAPDPSYSVLLTQQKILAADPAGLKERQISVSIRTDVTAEYPGSGFRFILYGKDGGKKFSSDKPVTLQKLYAIVDSMPMRIDEIKQKRQP